MDSIYSVFRQIVHANREQPALIENGRTMTFGELSDLVDMIAGGFPEHLHRIGIVMYHRAEMIAVILAALKRGAAYVPAEPNFPEGRIHEMMSEADVDFIVTESSLSDKLKSFPLKFADCQICLGGMEQEAETAIAPDSPAYILYTSGTTGRPKGISVTNGNVCHYVRAFADEFHPSRGDVMLQYSVCSFDIFVEEVFAILLNGAALAIPSEADKKNLSALMQFVERHHVTMISGFPYLLAEMNHLPRIPSSLRLLISGGDVLRGVYVDHLLSQVEVYNTYGPSETTVCASYYHCNGGRVLEDGTYPLGHAVTGATIQILSSDGDGRQMPDGEVGEICISGSGVSLGYIGDHEEENRVFETLPDGSSRYHSGDLGYMLPDGNLAFLHRKDTQIMIYGKRVEVSEVESRLYQCSGIGQAVVRAYTDEDNLSYMTAYIVPSNAQAPLKPSALKKEMAKYLPTYMIPEFFVQLEEVPLNSNGKPDSSRLPVVMKESTLKKIS